MRPVAMAQGNHPIPSRTRKLSPAARMVLPGPPGGRVRRRRPTQSTPAPIDFDRGGRCFFVYVPSLRVAGEGFRVCAGAAALTRAVVDENCPRGRLARPLPITGEVYPRALRACGG